MSESLKKYLIRSIETSLTLDEFKSNKILLITSLGVIEGTPAFYDEENEFPNPDSPEFGKVVCYKLFEEIAKNYKKEYSTDENKALDGNDGFLILENVKMKVDNTIYEYPSLCVFFDQIIGVTIGSSLV